MFKSSHGVVPLSQVKWAVSVTYSSATCGNGGSVRFPTCHSLDCVLFFFMLGNGPTQGEVILDEPLLSWRIRLVTSSTCHSTPVYQFPRWVLHVTCYFEVCWGLLTIALCGHQFTPLTTFLRLLVVPEVTDKEPVASVLHLTWGHPKLSGQQPGQSLTIEMN